MQKQIQEQRQLTFEDINPDWSQIITEAGGYTKLASNRTSLFGQDKNGNVTIKNIGTNRNLGNYLSCIVGEPHFGY